MEGNFKDLLTQQFKRVSMEMEVVELVNKYGAEAVIEAAISCERRKQRELHAKYAKEIGELKRNFEAGGQ